MLNIFILHHLFTVYPSCRLFVNRICINTDVRTAKAAGSQSPCMRPFYFPRCAVMIVKLPAFTVITQLPFRTYQFLPFFSKTAALSAIFMRHHSTASASVSSVMFSLFNTAAQQILYSGIPMHISLLLFHLQK